MADKKLTQEEHRNPPEEEIERLSEKVSELEGLVALKDRELTLRDNRTSELEQAAAKSDGEIADLKQLLDESGSSLNRLSDDLTQAISSYKSSVTLANPEIPEELLSGDTISAVNDSLARAKTLVGKVREGLEAEILTTKVPAGAPQRTAPDLSSLSSREKIRYAIGGPSS